MRWVDLFGIAPDYPEENNLEEADTQDLIDELVRRKELKREVLYTCSCGVKSTTPVSAFSHPKADGHQRSRHVVYKTVPIEILAVSSDPKY